LSRDGFPTDFISQRIFYELGGWKTDLDGFGRIFHERAAFCSEWRIKFPKNLKSARLTAARQAIHHKSVKFGLLQFNLLRKNPLGIKSVGITSLTNS